MKTSLFCFLRGLDMVCVLTAPVLKAWSSVEEEEPLTVGPRRR
jgi:hypothetical protein